MNSNTKMVISVGEILYWLFFASLLFVKGIGAYDGQAIFKLALVISILCIGFKLCIEQYTAAEIICITVIIIVTGTTYFISGEKGMLLYGLMVIGMKNVDTKRIFCIGTVIWTIAFGGLAINSLLHIEDTVYKVHDKLGMGHIFRWGLGYSHPNVLHISYVVLAMFLIYMIGEKFRIKHAIFLFIGNCFVFLYSVSYTGFLVFIFLIAGRIYLLARKSLCKSEKVLLQLIFPGCVAISLIFPIVAEGKLFDIVNKILSTRLALAKYYLKSEFISLFGQRLSDITTRVLTMDNAYLFAFIVYGAVFFVILCVTTIWMINQLIKKEQYVELLITLVICIAGLTEPFLYNTSFKNLSFIFVGELLFAERRDNKEYSLIPVKGITGRNKYIELSDKKLCDIKEKVMCLLQFNIAKILAGIVGALLVGVIVSASINYPKGYVVYRVDCADIGEERHYYASNTKEYEDYLLLENFENGDEIEIFSGNIVRMEQIRNAVTGVTFGFLISYSGYSVIYYSKRKNGRRRPKNNGAFKN